MGCMLGSSLHLYMIIIHIIHMISYSRVVVLSLTLRARRVMFDSYVSFVRFVDFFLYMRVGL